MVKVEQNWQDNVKLFTSDAAIRWKATQPKDSQKIRSENSEDVLTWQVFRTLYACGILARWVKETLGIRDCFRPYFWQRQHDSSDIDADIREAIREVEPYHVAHHVQHTETDLILRGEANVVMCEMKLGYKCRHISRWRQSTGSPIVPDYEPHARLFITDKSTWTSTVARFAQLYKNLFIGNVLCRKWSSNGSPLTLHLLAVVNGATCDEGIGGSVRTYATEFRDFRNSCCAAPEHLHLVTWQEIGMWIVSETSNAQAQTQCGSDSGKLLSFIERRLAEHPLL